VDSTSQHAVSVAAEISARLSHTAGHVQQVVTWSFSLLRDSGVLFRWSQVPISGFNDRQIW
jgi:hypothetical protein